MKKNKCLHCFDEIKSKDLYCKNCQDIDIYKYGEFTAGLTPTEVKDYLSMRTNKHCTEAFYKKFNKIAGCNTCGVHICESCHTSVSLMYRSDVLRFADQMLYGTPTFWD